MTERFDGPAKVVIAPDSFKGSLTSVEVARALADGWLRARQDDTVELAPLADGGEGTLVAIEASGGWTRRTVTARGPLGRPVEASWLIADDGRRAMVELASASGLSRLRPDELDALHASTYGTGEVIAAVLDAGVRHIVLGVGGSATSDGAAGILLALGARLLDADGRDLSAEAAADQRHPTGPQPMTDTQPPGEPRPSAEMQPPGARPPTDPQPPGGADLARVATIELSGLDPRLTEVELRIACDVTNPLLGPRGAAATYGPQKGASPSDVATLDAALGHWADVLEQATGRRERESSGAGAAGGTTFGLACIADRLRSFETVPGVDLVMDETGLDDRLAAADLVITGEGRIDAQTAFGKTALGVARRAFAAGVPCVAVGGGVEPGGIEALATLGVIAVPVTERPMSIAEAMAAGPEPLARCAERIARLISLGSPA